MKINKTLYLVLITFLTVACKKDFLVSKQNLKQYNYQEVNGFYNANNTSLEEPDNFPQYPNGLKGLMSDVNSYIRYPKNAVDNGIEGKVVVRYIIEKDGNIKEISIEKGVTKDLDEEAIRVIKKLRAWYPGFKNGKPVKVEFFQPFDFKLQ